MSGIDSVVNPEIRYELKRIRSRMAQMEQALSRVVDNGKLVGVSGYVPYYVQDPEPSIGDQVAVWVKLDGSVYIKMRRSAGNYDWMFVGSG